MSGYKSIASTDGSGRLKRYSGYLNRTAGLSLRADIGIGIGIKPRQRLDLTSKSELPESN